MKWFKRLFRGKSEKVVEPGSSKINPCFEKIGAWDSFKSHHRERLVSIGEEASEETVTEFKEVYAVTTAKNFRGDTLDQFVFESDWVFLTKDQFLEAKFQQRLARSDTLATFCRKRAGDRSTKTSTVVAKPPLCHCSDLNCEESVSNVPKRESAFRRFVNAMTRFWRRFYRKLKSSCAMCKKKSKVTKGNERLSEDSNFTQSYLCR